MILTYHKTSDMTDLLPHLSSSLLRRTQQRHTTWRYKYSKEYPHIPYCANITLPNLGALTLHPLCSWFLCRLIKRRWLRKLPALWFHQAIITSGLMACLRESGTIIFYVGVVWAGSLRLWYVWQLLTVVVVLLVEMYVY